MGAIGWRLMSVPGRRVALARSRIHVSSGA